MHYLDLVPRLLIPELTKASMLSSNVVNAQGGKWGEAGGGTGIQLVSEHNWTPEATIAVFLLVFLANSLIRINDPYRLGRRR